jgi:hypothetical protein
MAMLGIYAAFGSRPRRRCETVVGWYNWRRDIVTGLNEQLQDYLLGKLAWRKDSRATLIAVNPVAHPSNPGALSRIQMVPIVRDRRCSAVTISLEETDLLPEILRLDHRLTEQAL